MTAGLEGLTGGSGGVAGSGVERFVNLRPGVLERSLVVLVFVTVVVGDPSNWFLARTDPNADFSEVLATVALLFAAGLGTLRVFGSGDLWVRVVKSEPAYFGFVGLLTMSTFWSASPYDTARFALDLVLLSAFACYAVMRYETAEWIRLAAVAAMLVLALETIFVFGLPEYGRSTEGWTGVHSQKNGLGVTATFEVLTLLIASRLWPRRRFLLLAFFVLGLALLVGSQSKTALVAIGGALAMMPVFAGFRARRTLPGAVAAAFFSVGGLTLAFVTANLGAVTEALGKDLTFTGRTEIWKGIIPVFLDRPILGWGHQAAFGGYFSPVHEAFIQAGWQAAHAHNALLQIVLEVGLVGVAVFLFMYVRVIRRSIVYLRRTPGSLGQYPLALLALAFLLSITEAGVTLIQIGYLHFSLVVLTVGHVVVGDRLDAADQATDAASSLSERSRA